MITELKAKYFDLLREQANLQKEMQRIETDKQKLLKQISEEENGK